jgi:hypothetical protein
MIADEFVEIERRRQELFGRVRICPAELSNPDTKPVLPAVLLCHCGEIEATECRCWG